jgi:hypothetical protein
MNTNNTNPDTSNSWGETLAGTGLFILWGLALIISALPMEQEIPPWVFYYLILGILLLPSIGMCIGWIRGFPRWSYPYVSHVILFSVYMTNISIPGFQEEVWGWRALIPLGGAVAIAILFTHSVDPIIKFFTNIWDDWTLLAFGIFGLIPWRVVMSFGIPNRVYMFYVMLALTLLMSSAALYHMRASQQRQRIVSLLVGSALMATVAAGVHLLLWQKTELLEHLPLTIVQWISIVLSTLFPYLIELWRRATLKWDAVQLSSPS